MDTNIENDPFLNEIYSVDISGDFIIFGGYNELFNVLYKNEVNNFGGIFEDSIIYCKFYEEKKFYLVSYDGIVMKGEIILKKSKSGGDSNHIYEIDKINEIDNDYFNGMNDNDGLNKSLILESSEYVIVLKKTSYLKVDICSVKHKNDILCLGCSDGTISIFIKNETFLIQGTVSPIIKLEISNNYILAASENEFMVFQGYNMIYRMEKEGIKYFYCIENEIYLILDDSVILCKFCPERKLNQNEINFTDFSNFLENFRISNISYNSNLIKEIFKFEKNVEYIRKINDTIIFAGEYLEMNTKNQIFKIGVKNVNFLINKNNFIIFATVEGKIYWGDYRETQFREVKSEVGIVYDMVLRDKILVVCGENGIQIIEV